MSHRSLVPFSAMGDSRRNSLQTTIRIDRETWRRLRALAEDRALREGGRPSASAVIEELINNAVAVRGRKDTGRA